MSPAPAPVLFDLDGTLCDSRRGIVEAINLTLVAEGRSALPSEELVPRIGPPTEETFAELLGKPADAVAREVAEYRERYAVCMLTGTDVYPGVVGLLDALAAEGRPLAVATSKAERFARGLLEHVGLADRFAAICGPHPPVRESKAGTVARALSALELSAGAPGVWLVGDRVHDVEGGHAHGLRVLGALWGYGSREELADADALAVAPADVPALLAG